MRSMIVPWWRSSMTRGGDIGRRGHVRPQRPGALQRELAGPERGVDREDLLAVHGPDGAAPGRSWPRTTSVIAISMTDGGRAYDRYWAVAHTSGRPVDCSSASIEAPRPQPPKSAPRPEHSCGTTGSSHVFPSPERVRPKNERASTRSM